MPSGTHISLIRVLSTADMVTGLRFICIDGNASPLIGGYNVTSDVNFQFTTNYLLIGLLGMVSGGLRQVRFITAKTGR